MEWQNRPVPTTPVDRDKLADIVAVDDHARKLVDVKAKRDLARFEWLTTRPVSFKEALTAAVGAALVLAMLIAVIVALSK